MYNFQNYTSQNNETKISFWAMCEIKIFLSLFILKTNLSQRYPDSLIIWLFVIHWDDFWQDISKYQNCNQSNAVKYPWLCVTGLNFKKQNLLLTKLISDKNESKVSNPNEKNEFQKYDIWKIDLVPSE